MVTFRSLEQAERVAALGSFSAAAKELGVRQPTVSATISDLENELNVRLFTRSRTGVELTEAGREMIPAMLKVLQAVSAMTRLAGQFTPQDSFRVGITPVVGIRRVVELLEGFQQQVPTVTFSFREVSNAVLEQHLAAGSIDVAFASGLRRTKETSRHVVFNDRLRVVTKSRVRSVEISLQDVAKSPLLLTEDACGLATATRAAFAREHVPIRAYEGTGRDHVALLEWAKMGLGTAIIPEHHAPTRTPLLTDAHGPIRIESHTTWRKQLTKHETGAKLVRYLRRIKTLT